MHSSLYGRQRLLSGALAGATLLAVTAVAGPAAAAARREPLRGSTPRWLHQAHDLGATSTGAKVNFGVLLGMRDTAGAEATLAAISDPASSTYGQWLSNAAFKARYAPSPADVSAVQAWLRGEGFRVTTTLPSGMYVEASGSVAQIEHTFGTAVHNFTFQGTTVRANATELTLPAGTPAAVTAAISGVVGIDQGSTLKQPASTEPGPPPGARYGVQPCSDYFGQKTAVAQPAAYGSHQPYAVCGYGPQQFQSAYGESALLRAGVTGRGVTVAITDAYASPTIYGDAQRYNQVHHQPLFGHGQFRQITPAPDGYSLVDECDAQGWYGEETLDVEAVHAMAPGAKVVYVGASDCSAGSTRHGRSTIDNHIADVVTNSWTGGIDDITCSVPLRASTTLLQEAALTGITVNLLLGGHRRPASGGTQTSPPRPSSLPADLPLRHRGRRHQRAIGQLARGLGEYGWQSAYATLSRQLLDPDAAGPVQLRWWRRDQPAVRPTLLPGPQGPAGIDLGLLRLRPDRAVPDISMPGDPDTGFGSGRPRCSPTARTGRSTASAEPA